MPRYKINLQYDGTNYQGWQSQSSGRTIQDSLESALSDLNLNDSVRVVGAGRTDAGVHAWDQTAHVDLDRDMDPDVLVKALNSRLAKDISIRSASVVSPEFHARFSASSRSYQYQCCLENNLLFRNQAWITGSLNQGLMNRLAKFLIGEHDYLSFSKVNPDLENTLCTVLQSKWIKDRNMLIYHISANRFLHHMVRYLTGCMVECSRKRFTELEFIDLLRNPRKKVKIHKAPPQGLILTQVTY